MEGVKGGFKILTGDPTGKRPLGRRRWEVNIRISIKEIGVNTRNRIDSAQDKSYFVNAALNILVT